VYDIVPAFEFNEEVDLKKHKAWFLDGTHSVPPWTPMFGWFWINFCRHGMQYGAEKLSLPTVKGWDWRFKNGGGYLALYVIEDEEEIKQREVKFRQAIRPLIENYEGVWGGFVSEILGHYDRLKQVDVDKADNIELLAHFEDVINVCRRMWEIHMYMMYGVYTAFILFENICRELLGIDDTHPQFHSLLRGFDNKVFQVDKRLWQFSKRATELGLADLFLNTEAKDIISKLEKTDAGKKWLKEFREFMDEDGWRMQRMSEINLPYWVEDPTPAVTNVKQFLAKGGDFDLDAQRAKLAEERKQAEKEVLARIPKDQREWFETLMRLAQRSGSFSEEHNHYLDLYTHALIRRCLLGIGRRLLETNTIEDPEDTFFLMPDEVRRVMIAPEFHDLRPLVKERRAEWQKWGQGENPPMIGTIDMMEAVGGLVKSNDPIALKVVVGAMPVERPELKADLYGICGSAGVAEGPARVILSVEQLGEVQEGDILVAITTAPSWTPVFPLLKGVVVDRGASLSHAAIVGREYGIPVVMNVFVGTQKIKTGQRIKVDGTQGLVYILDK
jgi:pyruvate,water dikinase